MLIALPLMAVGCSGNNNTTGDSSDSSSSKTASTQGRAVFSITDAAANLENISAVRLSVNNLQVQASGGAWTTINLANKEFDLLALKESNSAALLADANLEAGTYNQLRLNISKVIVVQNGVESEAKLPSQELKIVGRLTVEAGKTSTAALDFLVDKSLHITGKGEFILAPVVKLETAHNAEVEIQSDTVVVKSGGKADANITVGMDLSGQARANFILDAKTKLDLVGGAIHEPNNAAAEAKVKITAGKAVEIAITSGNVQVVLSIKLEIRSGIQVWHVTANRQLEVVNIFIDANTGAVVAIE